MMVGCASSNQPASTTADAGNGGSQTKKSRKGRTEEVYNPSGIWRYEILTPNQENYGIMKITGQPGYFEVLLETDQFGELRVYNLEMTGESMSGMVDFGGSIANIDGDFDGDEFDGAITVGDNTYPIEATRTS